MKKIILLILAVIMCFSFEGCNGDHQNPGTTITTTDPVLPITGREKIEQFWIPVDEYHYREVALTADPMECLDFFMEKKGSWAPFKEAYINATEMKWLPVYGERLEETNLRAYLFYIDQTLIDATILSIVESGETFEINIFCSDVALYPYQQDRTSAHPQEYYNQKKFMQECQWANEFRETFTIEGVLLCAQRHLGYNIFGHEKGETELKYVSNNGPASLRYIEPVSDISSAQTVYQQYWEERLQILSSIYFYPWKEKELNSANFMAVHGVNSLEAAQLYYQTDGDMLVIPLLSNELGEDYQLHLMYQGNQLMGEVVTKTDTYEIVWTRLNVTKDAKGDLEFSPLEGVSTYEKTLNTTFEANKKENVLGVILDLEQENPFVPFGEERGTVKYLN
ncbi:MAG: hypothetical protein IJY42_02895 [Clostridia bacterium]|nr:hypothetical protein [Clostridia bacterium]